MFRASNRYFALLSSICILIQQTDSSHPGYGWLAVFSGFCVVFIVDGIHYSFGTLLIEIVEDFDQGRALTGAIVSITFACACILAPVTGHIAEFYGSRMIVIIGATISSTGFALSMFATNVYHLWATFGLLGGIGFGMMYSPAHVCVIHNFKDRRTLASGIVACGSGFGTITVNQMVRPLIDHYGWKGTILLEAGVALQGVVIGLFLVRRTSDAKTKSMDTSHSTPNVTVSSNFTRNINVVIDENCFNNDVTVEHCISSIIQLDTSRTNTEDNVKKETTSTEKINDDPECKAHNEEFDFRQICKSMFDLKLFEDKRCFLIVSAVFIMSLGYGIPFTFIPDQVVESGLTKQEALWLMSSIGVAGIVSRISFGILGDCKFVNRLNLLVIILCVNGILTAFSPLMENVATKAIYCCLFGALSGGVMTIYPVVLTDIFGDDMFSKSFGLVLTSLGLGILSGTPIGGAIFGITGSYNVTFVIAGIEFFLSGILFLLCKCFKGEENDKETKQFCC
ncbi:solute carrier 16 [Mactra antiquata]